MKVNGQAISPRPRARPQPKIPNGVKPYAPGEGYGSNVIPFSGYAPKSLKRRSSTAAQQEALALMKRAQHAGRMQRIEAMRRRDAVVQTVPVPVDQLQHLEEGGWLDAARAEGCNVRLDSVVEAHGISWRRIRLSGSTDSVHAATLSLMAGLAPKPAGAKV